MYQAVRQKGLCIVYNFGVVGIQLTHGNNLNVFNVKQSKQNQLKATNEKIIE